MRFLLACACSAALLLGSGHSTAQTIGAAFTSQYSLVSLGSVTNVPTNYGGIAFLDNDTLLLGGAANNVAGAIYSAELTRDLQGHVTAIGAASLFATAPNIDGGLTFGPGGVLLFSGYPTNTIGQIKPGSSAPDKTSTVSSNGVNSSLGSLVFVPQGFGGAGQLKVISYNFSTWQSLPYSPDGSGTLDFGTAGPAIEIGGGPEGAAYVPIGSALFASPSVLVSEYLLGSVAAYEVDANGDPLVATRRVLVNGLSGAEGAAIDPVTGDFFFSTFGGGNQVIRVTGFATPVPEPGLFALFAAGLGLLALAVRRRTIHA